MSAVQRFFAVAMLSVHSLHDGTLVVRNSAVNNSIDLLGVKNEDQLFVNEQRIFRFSAIHWCKWQSR